MKIYITGSVGSGKSTLARKMAKKTGAPCWHLDEVVYIPAPVTGPRMGARRKSWGNEKRPLEERNALFQAALAQPHYIMEDAGRKYFMAALEQADQVILQDISPALRRYRILFRWIKQRLGLEASGYRPSLGMLRAMFGWARDYETGKDGTRAMAERFSYKLLVLHSPREIKKFLASLGPVSSISP